MESPFNQRILHQKRDLFLSLSQLSSKNPWKRSVQKDFLTIHTYKDSKGITLIRSEGPIHHSTEKVFSLFWNDVEALKKVDDSIAQFTILKRSSDDTCALIHSKLKPALMVSPRDIVMLISYEKKGKDFIIYGSSVDYSEEKGFVRANCIVWGWILKENEKDINKSWAINVNYTDLGGRIPSFAIKPVLIKEQGYLIKRANDYLDKHHAENNKTIQNIKPKL